MEGDAYRCNCAPGFAAVVNDVGVATDCRDIDECEADEATGATVCGECYDSVTRQCPVCSQTSGDGQTPLPNTFYCSCPAGMTGGGEESPCVDIDECNVEPAAADCTSEDATITGACELDVAAQRCAPATGYGACSFIPEVKGPADVCGPGGECNFGAAMYFDPGFFYCHCTYGHHGGGDNAVYRPAPYASKRCGVTSVSERSVVTRAHAPWQECRTNTCTCGNGTAAAGAACATHGAHSCVMVNFDATVTIGNGPVESVMQR